MKNLKQASKFLSLILRHRPETIGISLDKEGWAVVDDLIKGTSNSKTQLTEELLEELVSTSDKKRFAFNKNHTKIRCQQGHSIDIDLGLKPKQPPDFLYHGTSRQFVGSILKEGIKKGERHHVHLSSDKETATVVGGRRGQHKIFLIDSYKMNRDGYVFFLSGNEVWLTDFVPSKYIRLL